DYDDVVPARVLDASPSGLHGPRASSESEKIRQAKVTGSKLEPQNIGAARLIRSNNYCDAVVSIRNAANTDPDRAVLRARQCPRVLEQTRRTGRGGEFYAVILRVAWARARNRGGSADCGGACADRRARPRN